MTTRLETLRAERDAIEAADQWDHPAHEWLCEQVERLEREEKAKAPAPQATPTTTPPTDSFQALQAEMEAALVNPERFTDAQRDQLVTRCNAAVIVAGQSQRETTDLGQLQRDMLTTGDGSALDDQAREALLRRYNQAAAQAPERRSDEVLRADLEGGDLLARMHAAAELQARGLLGDGVADQVVSEYQQACQAANERGLDVAALPPELRPAAEAILAARKALEVPAEPTEAALHQLDQAIRSMRPPTLAEQLEGLGIQPEPEPVSTSTTNAGEA